MSCSVVTVHSFIISFPTLAKLFLICLLIFGLDRKSLYSFINNVNGHFDRHLKAVGVMKGGVEWLEFIRREENKGWSADAERKLVK